MIAYPVDYGHDAPRPSRVRPHAPRARPTRRRRRHVRPEPWRPNRDGYGGAGDPVRRTLRLATWPLAAVIAETAVSGCASDGGNGGAGARTSASAAPPGIPRDESTALPTATADEPRQGAFQVVVPRPRIPRPGPGSAGYAGYIRRGTGTPALRTPVPPLRRRRGQARAAAMAAHRRNRSRHPSGAPLAMRHAHRSPRAAAGDTSVTRLGVLRFRRRSVAGTPVRTAAGRPVGPVRAHRASPAPRPLPHREPRRWTSCRAGAGPRANRRRK